MYEKSEWDDLFVKRNFQNENIHLFPFLYFVSQMLGKKSVFLVQRQYSYDAPFSVLSKLKIIMEIITGQI